MTVIFDIDGTLSNPDHRRPFLKEEPKNWSAFNETISLDSVYYPARQALHLFAQRHVIFVVSARESTSEIRTQTVQWLFEHTNIFFKDDLPLLTDSQREILAELHTPGQGYGKYIKCGNLYMREPKDYRDDTIIKKELLDLIISQGYTPTIVFDDRTRVVNMWRENGLYVFNCNQSGDDF